MTTGDWIIICVMFFVGGFTIGYGVQKSEYSNGYSAGIHETEEVRQQILVRDSLNVLLEKGK